MISSQSLKNCRGLLHSIRHNIHHQEGKYQGYSRREIYQDSNSELTGNILLAIKACPVVIGKCSDKGTLAKVNGRKLKLSGHLCVIVFVLVIIWATLYFYGWRRKKRPNQNLKDSIKSDLEAAALPTPLISRPHRLLPVGQTFTIVKSPLSSNPRYNTPPRLRSTSSPMSANHAVPRKRTIVWFDESASGITDTHSGLASGAQLSDRSSESQQSDSTSDSISLRSERSHSLSILPESDHEVRRESSLASVSALWLRYQAHQA
ncbi:hypothetical protein DFH28DRAFT_1019038 [Melampsora americana]|nr:hypothetical protein DFH28DRAFT_1019038 [Melampsora americana]